MNDLKIKETMKLLVYGVYIIIVKYKEKVNAMTAAWVSQISSDPPMVSVAIGKNHFTAQLIPNANIFSINFISPNQKELAKRCGSTTGKYIDKLEDGEISYSDCETPVLKKSIGYLECDFVKQVDTGDHYLFIGTVKNADKKGDNVLVFKPDEFFK